MESFGVEKRDIRVDRVEEARDAAWPLLSQRSAKKFPNVILKFLKLRGANSLFFQ